MSLRASRELLSFVAVGSIGFLIEAMILTMLTSYAGWSPWLARIPSFFTAVTVTWALNRQHTFPRRGLQRSSVEAFWYVAIQGGGITINLILFGATLAALPQLRSVPVIPLGIGSAGALAFNFLLNSKVLYARPRQEKDAHAFISNAVTTAASSTRAGAPSTNDDDSSQRARSRGLANV